MNFYYCFFIVSILICFIYFYLKWNYSVHIANLNETNWKNFIYTLYHMWKVFRALDKGKNNIDLFILFRVVHEIAHCNLLKISRKISTVVESTLTYFLAPITVNLCRSLCARARKTSGNFQLTESIYSRVSYYHENYDTTRV